MKIIQRLAVFAIILFILGIFFTASYLNSWRVELLSTLKLSRMEDIEKLRLAVANIFWVVGVETALGLFAILMLLLSRRRQVETIYVERVGKIGQQKGSDSQAATEDQTDNTSINNSQKQLMRNLLEVMNLHNNNREFQKLLEQVLRLVCTHLEAGQGGLYLAIQPENEAIQAKLVATYAYYTTETRKNVYEVGEGLVGQVMKDGKLINLKNVPEGYIMIVSGLGNVSAKHLTVVPVINEYGQVLAVFEIASLREFSEADEALLTEVALLLAKEIAEGEYQNILLD
jgi:putative methionine-R-sulfoxide reductase with GAF domain